MEPISEATQCYDQMAIIEKYERVIAYLYPIAQSMPRRHGIARDKFLHCLFSVPDLLYQASGNLGLSAEASTFLGIVSGPHTSS